jgi:hypothetical protein
MAENERYTVLLRPTSFLCSARIEIVIKNKAGIKPKNYHIDFFKAVLIDVTEDEMNAVLEKIDRRNTLVRIYKEVIV